MYVINLTLYRMYYQFYLEITNSIESCGFIKHYATHPIAGFGQAVKELAERDEGVELWHRNQLPAVVGLLEFQDLGYVLIKHASQLLHHGLKYIHQQATLVMQCIFIIHTFICFFFVCCLLKEVVTRGMVVPLQNTIHTIALKWNNEENVLPLVQTLKMSKYS